MVQSRGHAWGCTALLLAASLVAGSAHAADDEARKHFMAGVSYLQDQEGARYEEAYAEFKVAYDLSRSPKVLGNLGLSAMKLERDGEAISAYTRYLAEVADIDPDERAQIQRDLETLKASAVRVSVVVHDKGGSLFDTRFPVRGANINNVYSTVVGKNEYVLRPGHHVIVLKIEGREAATWEVTATVGTPMEHDFIAKKSTEGAPRSSPGTERVHSSVPVLPIVVTGVGVTVLAVGGVAGLATLGKVHDLERNCPNNTCPPQSYDTDVSNVRNWVRATDFLLLGGGVVTAVGITLLLLPNKSASHGSTDVSAMCTGAGCYGTVRLGF